VYFKALDDAAWFAANSVVEDVFVLTTRFEVKLLRPVSEGEILAVGAVTSSDERRIYAQAELFDAQGGRLVASGEGDFARGRVPLGPEVNYR
jgi:acyl-coenzyme A thioesterase PaaI-like protein